MVDDLHDYGQSSRIRSIVEHDNSADFHQFPSRRLDAVFRHVDRCEMSRLIVMVVHQFRREFGRVCVRAEVELHETGTLVPRLLFLPDVDFILRKKIFNPIRTSISLHSSEAWDHDTLQRPIRIRVMLGVLESQFT